MAESNTISIRINGEEHGVPTGLSVSTLLSHLDISSNRVAVERNRIIVSKKNFDKTMVESGDQIEIVTFIGGG